MTATATATATRTVNRVNHDLLYLNFPSIFGTSKQEQQKQQHHPKQPQSPFLGGQQRLAMVGVKVNVDFRRHMATASEPKVRNNNNNNNNNNHQQRRQVRFDTATVYEHYGMMGDNPACSKGFPLTIDWECANQYSIDLSKHHDDDHEEMEIVFSSSSSSPHEDRQEQQQQRRRRQELPSEFGIRRNSRQSSSNGGGHRCRRRRRNREELRLSALDREFRLVHDLGYTRKELIRLGKPVNIARAQRQRTLETMALEPIQSLFQTIRNKVASSSRSTRARVRRFLPSKKTTKTNHHHPGGMLEDSSKNNKCHDYFQTFQEQRQHDKQVEQFLKDYRRQEKQQRKQQQQLEKQQQQYTKRDEEEATWKCSVLEEDGDSTVDVSFSSSSYNRNSHSGKSRHSIQSIECIY